MGKVFRFNKDVDTDQIIASQYLLYPTVVKYSVLTKMWTPIRSSLPSIFSILLWMK